MTARRFGRDGGEVPAPPLPPAWTPRRPGGAPETTRLPPAGGTPDEDVAEEVWWAVAAAAEPTTLSAETADLVERCVRAALTADRAHRDEENRP